MPFTPLDKQQHPDFVSRGKKPTGPVEIDITSSIQRKLVKVELFNYTGSSNTQPLRGNGGDITSVQLSQKNGLEFTTGTAHVWYNKTTQIVDEYAPYANGEGFFFAFSIECPTVPSTDGAVIGRFGAAGDRPYMAWIDVGGTAVSIAFIIVKDGVGSTTIGIDGPAISAGQKYNYVCNYIPGRVQIWRDGVLVDSSSTTIEPAATASADGLSIGTEIRNATSRQLTNTNIHYVFVGNQGLTDSEASSLSTDPYQILKPAVGVFAFWPSAAAAGTKKLIKLDKLSHPDFRTPRTKPSSGVRIDWNKPLTKGLKLFWLATSPDVELVTGQKITRSLPMGVKQGQRMAIADGSSLNTIQLPAITVGNELTVLAEVHRESDVAAADDYMFDNIDGTSRTFIYHSNVNSNYSTYIGGTFTTGTPVSSMLPVGELRNVGFTWNANNTSEKQKIFTSGEKIDTGNVAVTGGFSFAPKLMIRNSDQFPFDGGVGNFFVFDRELTENEVKALNDDPYQILMPSVDMIGFYEAAAPGSFKAFWANMATRIAGLFR